MHENALKEWPRKIFPGPFFLKIFKKNRAYAFFASFQ